MVIRQSKGPRGRLVLYALPIVIGLGGVIFSQQMPTPLARTIVLILSVSIPIFAGGNMLARYHAGRIERTILFAGVVMLAMGAVMGLSDIRETLESQVMVPPVVADLSRVAGLVGVLAGLFVVLYMVARTGEDVDEMSERFRHVADRIGEGFVLSSPEGTIFMVNNRFLEMFDLKREEVVGQSVYELSERMGADMVGQQFQNRTRGFASEYEITGMVRGEERRFWFNGTPIQDASGRHTATLATVRDITEMHRLSVQARNYAQELQQVVALQSQQLDASEAQFRRLLLSMNEGFLTLDANYKVRFSNRRVAELLRVDEKDLEGRDIFDFVDTPGRMRLLNLLSQSGTLPPEESRQEISFVTARGEYTPTVVAVASAGETESSPVYSLVITGVAELKEMQRKLEERAVELQRVNDELRMHDRAKDAFLSNVSHELRTPLSTIQGYLEMFQAGTLGEFNEKQEKSLTVMARNAQRLLVLINEMIEFSRIEIRGVQLDIGLFSFDRLVQDFVTSIHPHTRAKHIEVTAALPPAPVMTWGDRNRLGQVLGILLNNAVKFTDEGGRIALEARIGEGHTLEVSVSDTGIGIDPLYHEQIFTKFFQVDSSKTRRYEGAGIGLSLAKSVVEGHGGQIRLDSALGKGSAFTVILPGAVFDAALPEELPANLNGMPMLIAEAGTDLFVAVKDSLERLGCVVRHSDGAHACVRAAEEFTPEVIVINDGEKDRTGQATLPLLRQNPMTSAIPVLVISSESLERQLEVRTMFDSVEVLPRPFDMRAFLLRLEASLSGGLEDGFAETAHGTDSRERARIMVVDSDPGLLEWAEVALQCRGVTCLCAPSPRRALSVFRDQKPDVIFVDVDVPGAAVADHVRLFKDADLTRDVPIYIMTGMPGVRRVPEGVSGVLEKPISLDRLVALAEVRAESAVA